jgi:FkbM family methyltransferase
LLKNAAIGHAANMQFRFLWRGLKAYYRDQRCELRALMQGLQPTDIAVDVGANKGSYLWALSRAVPQGRVVAFEPQPSLVEYLREAVASNGLKNVCIEPFGVSSQPGRMVLAIPGNKIGSPGASFEPHIREQSDAGIVEVAVITLDEYFANEQQRIGAIKIDVEGHELAVLRGAREIIRRHAPAIVVECEGRSVTGGDVRVLFDTLAELNYRGEFVHRQRLKAIEQFDAAVHQPRQGKRYWDHPDYCNNFVFRPAA